MLIRIKFKLNRYWNLIQLRSILNSHLKLNKQNSLIKLIIRRTIGQIIRKQNKNDYLNQAIG